MGVCEDRLLEPLEDKLQFAARSDWICPLVPVPVNSTRNYCKTGFKVLNDQLFGIWCLKVPPVPVFSAFLQWLSIFVFDVFLSLQLCVHLHSAPVSQFLMLRNQPSWQIWVLNDKNRDFCLKWIALTCETNLCWAATDWDCSLSSYVTHRRPK